MGGLKKKKKIKGKIKRSATIMQKKNENAFSFTCVSLLKGNEHSETVKAI